MGTIIRNGIEYGGGISPDIEDKINNAKGIEITQAEYDALSEEEQKTGLYWITDVDSGSNSINALTSDDVVDNLGSTATDVPLSANMGRELKEKMEYVECDLLLTADSTDFVKYEVPNLLNYKYILLCAFTGSNNDSFSIVESTMIPVSLFKILNSSSKTLQARYTTFISSTTPANFTAVCYYGSNEEIYARTSDASTLIGKVYGIK